MKRITDRPARLRFLINESAANTYTEEDIELPVAVLSSNRIQAIEIVGAVIDLDTPDLETDQENMTTLQLVRDSQSGLIAYDDDDLIFRQRKFLEARVSTNGGQTIFDVKPSYVNLAEHKEDGELVMERTIHIGIMGTGNAGAKQASGYFDYHLVELGAAEVVTELFLDDDN